MKAIVYIICIMIIGMIVSFAVESVFDEKTRMNTTNQEISQRIDSLEQKVIHLENEVTELEDQIDYLYH